MFGHRWFAARWFPARWFGPAAPSVPGVQVLNYGVMRRRREEYEEAQRREAESLDEFAHEIAARIDEGLPEPLRPEPTADEPEPERFTLPSNEAVTARVAAEIEARLRGELAANAQAAPVDDYDDDEEAILALLLAPPILIEANDDDEEALIALLLAA